MHVGRVSYASLPFDAGAGALGVLAALLALSSGFLVSACFSCGLSSELNRLPPDGER
ncbi:MAG: hypothetical protein ROW52_06250 [Anaerolineaceae bacterium]